MNADVFPRSYWCLFKYSVTCKCVHLWAPRVHVHICKCPYLQFNPFYAPVAMANNWFPVTLQNDFKLDRLMELIRPNDKLSIPINQDNCSAAVGKHSRVQTYQRTLCPADDWSRSRETMRSWSTWDPVDSWLPSSFQCGQLCTICILWSSKNLLT